MTSFNWRESSFVHDLLWGNAYSLIEMDKRGKIVALWPITPDRVTTRRDKTTRKIVHDVTSENAPIETLPTDLVLHVPGLGFDGIIGKSVIGLHREAIALAQVTEQHGAKFFGAGARPGGVLKNPNRGSKAAATAIQAAWQEDHGGPDNAHKVAVLFEGMDFQATTIPNEDSQFLETRTFQVAEIARMFGVPLWLLMSHDKDTSWGSGIEQQGIALVTYTFMAWIRRWEQAINCKLFSATERAEGYYVGFDVKGLLRGDFKSRVDGYHFAITDGWMNRNEVRGLEDMDLGPDDLDVFLLSQGGVSLQPVRPTEEQRKAFAVLFRSLAERVVKRAEQDWPRVAAGKLDEVTFYTSLDGYTYELFDPAVASWKSCGGETSSSKPPCVHDENGSSPDALVRWALGD